MKSRNLLLVDSSVSNGDIMGLFELMSTEGNFVVTLMTHEQAMIGNLNNYDWFVIDGGRKDDDGIALCELIRRTNPRSVIVLTSTKVDDDSKGRSKQAGFDEILQIPYSVPEVIALLDSCQKSAAA